MYLQMKMYANIGCLHRMIVDTNATPNTGIFQFMLSTSYKILNYTYVPIGQ